MSIKANGSQIAILFLLIGVAFVAAGVVGWKVSSAKESHCDATAIATVVDMIEGETEDGYVYYPVLQYMVNGQEYKGRYSIGSYPPAFEIGGKTRIMYNSEDPWEFIVKGDSTPIILVIVFSILGVAMVLVGVTVLILVKSRRI